MRNNFRSMWIFIGFAIAFQLVCGVLLAPILLFTDPTSMIFVNPKGFLWNYGIYGLIFSAVVFAGNYFLHLENLQRDIGFRYVSNFEEPRLIRIVEPIAIASGVQVPKIAVLEIEELNAFVCGLGEGSATLVVTRGLINALDDDELGAVMAHEIAHIMNGDMRMMAFANVSVSSLTLLKRLNFLKIKSAKGAFFALIFPPFLILFLSAGFVMSVAMTLAKVSRLMIASSREFIADAEAVRLTHNPSALITALQKIEGRSRIEWLDPISDAMMIDGATDGELATHPTIADRINELLKHSGAMAYNAGPRKDTRFAERSNAVGFNGVAPAFGKRDSGGFDRRETANFGQEFRVVTKQDNLIEKTGSLINRVNTGSNENAFGLSPEVKKVMLIGFAIVVGVSMLNGMLMRAQFSTIASKFEVSSQLKGVESKPINNGIIKPK